jgi:hypothetical protein
MTTQTIFYADPRDATITGFIFTDLDSYHGEYDHRHCLYGTEDYELQVIRGKQIDQELFTGLKINQGNLNDWFDEIQHLTNEEKVGLWFLVRGCGYDLTTALEITQDGMTMFRGSKEEWISRWIEQTGFFHGIPDQFHADFDTANLINECVSEGSLQEFAFAGETWCTNPLGF